MQLIPARRKPVPLKAMQMSDFKQLVSALVAELGVEYSMVIHDFQPPPRTLPEECTSSSSPERTCDQLVDSARLHASALERDHPNSVNLKFSKLGVDNHLHPILPSSADPSTVLISLIRPTSNL